MRCKEIVRLLTYGRDAEPDVQIAITQHTRSCKKCREELSVNAVIKSFLKCYSHTDGDQSASAWEEARLVNQVKSRIQAARESGLGSWESAVISIRGWLVGFAAAAILLLALSGQLAISNSADNDNGRLELISNALTPSTIEDLISSNTQINRQGEPMSEEVENGR